MDILNIFILAVIQGITEFLPISSSSHLILLPLLTNYPDQGLGFDIAVHTGSLLAIIAFYKNELKKMYLLTDEGLKYLKMIIVASIPLPFFGLLFVDFISDIFRNLQSIGLMTIIFGLLLYFADRKSDGTQNIANLSIMLILVIGLFQSLALVPGISRSGIVITACLLLNLSRDESIKVAFMLSIPALLMASLYQGMKLYESENITIISDNIIGVILSFIFSYLTIKLFVSTINRITFAPYIIYRIILGTMLLII